ncbi:potassium channel family protein [Fundidesulfovibrio putealis]|uniref:potassium channel family protein n=1 Tax=Fundidesulfovibrio putealis TaxID=270496 RepID=UPI003899380A
MYFSFVTFSTLGFGDIHPVTPEARIWVMAEVMLGYIMLGGLISILANKLARRA